MKRLLVTTGEPAGIGPELCLHIAHANHLTTHKVLANHDIVFLADADMLQQRANMLGMDVTINVINPSTYQAQAPKNNHLNVWHHPLAVPSQAGILATQNARYVLNTLDAATDACLPQSATNPSALQAHAMVTAPVHKGIINTAGVHFTGHTEYLQQRCHSHDVVMMLTCDAMRIALATTHLPLQKVAKAITKKGLTNTLHIINSALKSRFLIAKPRIYVCGLNPHAGEGGHLGHEEINTIAPALEALRKQGMDLVGPLPADTIFNANIRQDADCVLAMYHDQGLPVLKYAGFGTAVNITLGLPIIRTSVDHGTALDLAGTGKAAISSLLAALQQACLMSQPTTDTDTLKTDY